VVNVSVETGTWAPEHGKAKNMSDRLAYSPAEAAELASISLAKLYEEARNNRLIIRKSGRRSLITHRDFEAWLDGLPQKLAPLANSAAS